MVRTGLNVYRCRSWRAIACRRHLGDGQHMGPSRQQGGITVTLHDTSYRPTIDLKRKAKIPSEVRNSVDGEATRREVMVRAQIPRRTALRNSADENCAPKNQHQKNIPREAVF